jgi:adenosylcobinamide-phosphate synthase
MTRGRFRAVPVGLLAGAVADAVFGDPARWHPVAGFGRLAGDLERRLWRPERRAGTAYLLVSVAPLVLGARAVERALAARTGLQVAYVALLTWAVVGAKGLGREAHRLERSLAAQDLVAARTRLSALCGRDAAHLDATGLRRAAIESVAENTSDAAVGPLVWGAAAGPAGLVGYRAVNTLDAMVGHRSERHARFGSPAARADDIASLVPARITAALAALLAPAVAGRPSEAIRAWRRDASRHPSPNAGPCEASFAGALGVRLGGPTRYPYGVSDRPWLGDGRDPEPEDLRRAIVLSRAVTVAAAVLCAALPARLRRSR